MPLGDTKVGDTLGGTKDEHFSCFHSSCQLGLTREIMMLFLKELLTH